MKVNVEAPEQALKTDEIYFLNYQIVPPPTHSRFMM